MRVLILAFSLFLFGCAQQIIKIEVPEIAKSAEVVVKDLRPASEKEKETFSYSITSSAYGIIRVPHAFLDPAPVRVLQHRVYEKFGAIDRTAPLTLTVHHLVIYANGKSSMRRSVLGGALGGIVGAAIASSGGPNTTKTDNFFGTAANRQVFDAQLKEEHERAFYTDAESIRDENVYVIYIDADVGGKRAFIKTISSASYNEQKNALGTAVEASIDFFVKQVGKQ